VPKILISKTFSFFIVLLLTKGTTYQGGFRIHNGVMGVLPHP